MAQRKSTNHNKSLQNYIKAREKAENKENLFLEKIADKDTTCLLYTSDAADE